MRAMSMPDPTTLPLRNRLLDACWKSNTDVNAVIQSIVDTLMISISRGQPRCRHRRAQRPPHR